MGYIKIQFMFNLFMTIWSLKSVAKSNRGMGYNGGCQGRVHGHCSRWNLQSEAVMWIITQFICLLALKLHNALESVFLSWTTLSLHGR